MTETEQDFHLFDRVHYAGRERVEQRPLSFVIFRRSRFCIAPLAQTTVEPFIMHFILSSNETYLSVSFYIAVSRPPRQEEDISSSTFESAVTVLLMLECKMCKLS
jgi:hypothetical protein